MSNTEVIAVLAVIAVVLLFSYLCYKSYKDRETMKNNKKTKDVDGIELSGYYPYDHHPHDKEHDGLLDVPKDYDGGQQCEYRNNMFASNFSGDLQNADVFSL